jgi:hypothetical protein
MMVLFVKTTAYRDDLEELDDPNQYRWGIDPDTVCALCADPVVLGDPVIVVDNVGVRPGKGVFNLAYFHPSCLDPLVTIVVQDMAKLIDETGFVLGEYMAARREPVMKSIDCIMFSGTVRLPADRRK